MSAFQPPANNPTTPPAVPGTQGATEDGLPPVPEIKFNTTPDQSASAISGEPPVADGGTADADPSQQGPPDDIQQLSETYGMDFSGYSTPEDAKYAAQQFLDHLVSIGVQGPAHTTGQPQAPQQYYTPPANPEPEPAKEPEEDLDLQDVDPAVRKHLEKVAADAKAAREELAQFRQREEQAKQQQTQTQLQEVSRRAHATLDSLNDPRFGTTAAANMAQQFARRNVLSIADSIVNGHLATGRPVPVIENVMKMAVEYHNRANPAPQQQVNQQVPGAPGASGPPPAPTSASFAAPKPETAAQRAARRKGVPDEQSAYLADPEFMAGAKAIVARG